MDEILELFIHEKSIKINIHVTENGTKYYRAKDVGNALQIANIRSSITNIKDEYKKNLKSKTNGGDQLMIFLTEDGVKTLLIKSRSSYVSYIADAL